METEETFAKKFSSILEKLNIVEHDEALALQKAFSLSDKELFDEFLLEEGLVEESDLLRALGQYYQTPSFDVVGYFFDYNLLRKFPKDFLLQEGIIPLEVENNVLSVVASDPCKPELEDSIRGYASYDIAFLVGLRKDICDAVKEFYDKSITEDATDIDLREGRRQEREVEQLEDETESIIK